MAQLRAALGALPLAGLAQLRVTAQAALPIPATLAAATLSASESAALAAAARVNMAPLGPLALALQVAAAPGLLMPPGSCGGLCPVGPLSAALR